MFYMCVPISKQIYAYVYIYIYVHTYMYRIQIKDTICTHMVGWLVGCLTGTVRRGAKAPKCTCCNSGLTAPETPRWSYWTVRNPWQRWLSLWIEVRVYVHEILSCASRWTIIRALGSRHLLLYIDHEILSFVSQSSMAPLTYVRPHGTWTPCWDCEGVQNPWGRN